MDKVTQFLVIITAACLLLAACGGKPSASTPGIHENLAIPTAARTQGKKLVDTPTLNGATISPTPGNPPEKMLVITRAMNGKTFSLKVGDPFEIQLTIIPMPGFEWTPQNLDTTILLQQGQPVYQADSSPNSAGGIVTLRFKAVGAGNTQLILVYLHPAANGVPALHNSSFGVNIEVK
jgi:predicted secreted protein